MPDLRQLDFSRVVALCFRMSAATIFREKGLAGRHEGASGDQAELAAALAVAARALRSRSNPPLSAAFSTQWGKVSASAPRTDSPGGKVLAARLQQFEEHLQKASAEAAELAGIATPQEAAYRICLREVQAILDALNTFVRWIYGRVVSDFSPPEIFLETAHLHEHQTTDMLDEAAITGTCRVSDISYPVSIVGLGFRDDAVDWVSLCQLPYVLMHELVCHAYQGLVGSGRRAASTGCGWSEGWMDALAFRFTEAWLKDASENLPDWLLESKSSVLQACATLHSRRRKPQSNLRPVDLNQRIALWEAVESLERAFRGKGRREAFGISRLLSFSLRLNLLAIPQIERNDTLDKLALALELFQGDRLDQVIIACSRFAEHGEWQGFKEALGDLIT